MAKQVVLGAMLKCSMGAAPSSFVVLPTNKVQSSFCFAANIMDYIPMTNIMPFGTCKSLANPTVAAATAAASGVLTQMPCIPATSAPWAAGAPTVMLANQPLLNDTSKCMCMWAGVIEVSNPGQTTEDTP